MSKHRTQRYNDEIHCRCGLTWGIDEADPHLALSEYHRQENTPTPPQKVRNLASARETIDKLKKDLAG